MNAGGHSHQGLGFRYYDKQGAGALPGGLLPMKTLSGRGENVPAIRPHQQPWTRRGSWVLVRGTLKVP